MECNKDEALRAKEIADRKFTEKDYSGARKFALKAQALFPGLDGIPNMLTTVDVHVSAENKVSGEMDLYGMLNVSPMADDDTIKKQYRKLLLLLHPDKNKSIGAENAFQLVSEAFTILADKTKRSAYNTRRHIRMAQRVPSQTTAPNVAKNVPQNRPPVRQPSTFRVVEQKVPVPVPPQSGPGPGPNGNHKRPRKSGPRGKYKKRATTQNFSQPTHPAQPILKNDNTFWTVCTRCNMQYEYMRVYLNQILKCPNCEMGFVAVEVPPPNLVARPSETKHHRVNYSHGGGKSAYDSQNKEKSYSGIQNGFSGYNTRINANTELNSTELKHMLVDKALLDLKEQVRKAALAIEKKTASKQKTIVKEKEQDAPEFVVPDPDFHIFDYDRLETCFKENQVWAAYDNNDGMPRFYALIHEVVSLNPFELKVSWLNSRNTTEFGSLDWLDRGFKKTCGDFWVGRYEITDLLNSFSHKVDYDKGPRGVIQIYPKKDEIWALYRNWSPTWGENTPDEVIHAYEMVQVLENYNVDEGIYVAEIIKVPDFRTVFRELPDPKVVKLIQKDEMFRFSHRVPHHTLTGNEKPNAPKGCLELDPAATPPELLQVIRKH